MQELESPAPWWTHGHLWLVISGPLVVVIAALATAWIAVRYQDPVLAADYYRQGLEINKTLPRQGSLAPAMQARNHAATPSGTLAEPRDPPAGR